MRLVKMLARVSNQEPRSVYEQSVEGAHTDDDEFGPGAEDEHNFEDEECLGKTEQGCASHVPLTEREIEGTLYELRLGTPESKVPSSLNSRLPNQILPSSRPRSHSQNQTYPLLHDGLCSA